MQHCFPALARIQDTTSTYIVRCYVWQDNIKVSYTDSMRLSAYWSTTNCLKRRLVRSKTSPRPWPGPRMESSSTRMSG